MLLEQSDSNIPNIPGSQPKLAENFPSNFLPPAISSPPPDKKSTHSPFSHHQAHQAIRMTRSRTIKIKIKRFPPSFSHQFNTPPPTFNHHFLVFFSICFFCIIKNSAHVPSKFFEPKRIPGPFGSTLASLAPPLKPSEPSLDDDVPELPMSAPTQTRGGAEGFPGFHYVGGQIITTVVTQNGGDCKGIPPKNPLNSGLGSIVWVVPPPSNSGNEGLGWHPLLKMFHNPGGDWNPGRGDNPKYSNLPSLMVFPVFLLLLDAVGGLVIRYRYTKAHISMSFFQTCLIRVWEMFLCNLYQKKGHMLYVAFLESNS